MPSTRTPISKVLSDFNLLSKQEQKLILAFRSTDDDGKKMILGMGKDCTELFPLRTKTKLTLVKSISSIGVSHG